jgi:hypothetical protein
MSTTVTKLAPQSGAGLLVKSLEAQGVKYVFGIPGAKIDKSSTRSSIPQFRRSSAATNKTLRS